MIAFKFICGIIWPTGWFQNVLFHFEHLEILSATFSVIDLKFSLIMVKTTDFVWHEPFYIYWDLFYDEECFIVIPLPGVFENNVYFAVEQKCSINANWLNLTVLFNPYVKLAFSFLYWVYQLLKDLYIWQPIFDLSVFLTIWSVFFLYLMTSLITSIHI
jgi:hypothetical protein